MQLMCLLSKVAPAESLLKDSATSPKEDMPAFLCTNPFKPSGSPTSTAGPSGLEFWSRSRGCGTGALWLRTHQGCIPCLGRLSSRQPWDKAQSTSAAWHHLWYHSKVSITCSHNSKYAMRLLKYYIVCQICTLHIQQ